MAVIVAGLLPAAVGGIATKGIVDEVTSGPHSECFSRSLEAGSLFPWVRVANGNREHVAARILTNHGNANVHTHKGPQSKR